MYQDIENELNFQKYLIFYLHNRRFIYTYTFPCFIKNIINCKNFKLKKKMNIIIKTYFMLGKKTARNVRIAAREPEIESNGRFN